MKPFDHSQMHLLGATDDHKFIAYFCCGVPVLIHKSPSRSHKLPQEYFILEGGIVHPISRDAINTALKDIGIDVTCNLSYTGIMSLDWNTVLSIPESRILQPTLMRIYKDYPYVVIAHIIKYGEWLSTYLVWAPGEQTISGRSQIILLPNIG